MLETSSEKRKMLAHFYFFLFPAPFSTDTVEPRLVFPTRFGHDYSDNNTVAVLRFKVVYFVH